MMNDGNRQNYNNNAMINDNRNGHSFMTVEQLQHHSNKHLRASMGSASAAAAAVVAAAVAAFACDE